MQIIDFDQIETWAPWFGAAMSRIVSPDVLRRVEREEYEWVEDARDALLAGADRRDFAARLDRELEPLHVRLFHGTRLTDRAFASLQAGGLKALVLADRAVELRSIFSQHPRWPEVEGRFDDVLYRLGPLNEAGRRQDGFIHFCISRNGLVNGCNHYLEFGAEIDSRVGQTLFGDNSAGTLLRSQRTPKIVSVIVPFAEARAAANPYFVPTNELPALHDMMVEAWAYFTSSRRGRPFQISPPDNTAVQMKAPIPRSRIESIQDVEGVPALRSTEISKIGPVS
jgi:hypothetical protein